MKGQAVIDIALAEVGYLEKKSNSQLDDKKANAGYNNWTKYARDLDNIPGFYNGKKNGYEWCDVFVDWCMVQAYGVEKAKQLLCQPSKSLGAGCPWSAGYYANFGQFYTSNPQPGDQIFFGSSRQKAYHTGLVYKVENGKVYTIEGNTSNSAAVVPNGGTVAIKSYPLNANYIAGYGRPAYEEEEEMTQEKFNEMMNNYLATLKDNDAGDWSKEAREWAVRNGLITGVNAANEESNYAWQSFLTREQMATILHRLNRVN